MDASNEVIKMFEANYPENIRRIFVVNGNLYIHTSSILM